MATKIKPLLVSGYVLAAFCLFGSLVFAYTAFVPINVLKDWHVATDKTMYNVGDKIKVNSSAVKTVNSTGTSQRFIVCKNSQNIEQQIEISGAIAGVRTGTRSSEIELILPDIAPLPAVCQIKLSITYTFYGYRNIVESNSSNSFMLYERNK